MDKSYKQEKTSIELPSTEEKKVEDTVTTEVKEETPVKKTKTGLVSGCQKLRIRTEPDGEVKEVVPEGTKLIISGDSKDWYEIETESGTLRGYCMKKFVKVS